MKKLEREEKITALREEIVLLEGGVVPCQRSELKTLFFCDVFDSAYLSDLPPTLCLEKRLDYRCDVGDVLNLVFPAVNVFARIFFPKFKKENAVLIEFKVNKFALEGNNAFAKFRGELKFQVGLDGFVSEGLFRNNSKKSSLKQRKNSFYFKISGDAYASGVVRLSF